MTLNNRGYANVNVVMRHNSEHIQVHLHKNANHRKYESRVIEILSKVPTMRTSICSSGEEFAFATRTSVWRLTIVVHCQPKN